MPSAGRAIVGDGVREAPGDGFNVTGGLMQPVEGDSSRAVYVHPNGLCESESVGSGTRVWAFAHVLRGAVIGRDCNICDGVYIEGGARVGDRVTVKNQVLIFDGVIVEDDVFLGPGVVFTNDLRPRAHIKRTGVSLLGTTVRRGATLGAGVTVVCGTMIGHDAFVGAGAVIVDDVPAHAFMLGNPARRIGWVCTCGERLPDDLVCAECGRRFQLDIGMPPEGGRPVLAAKPVCLSEIDPGSARANGPIGSERKT